MKKQFLIILALFILSCSGAQEIKPDIVNKKSSAERKINESEGVKYPYWFMNPEVEGHISAIGTAQFQNKENYLKQKKTAIVLGEAEIAKKIEVYIASQLTLKQRQQTSTTKQEYESELTLLSKQKAEALLKNVTIKEEWIHPNTGELSVWMVVKNEAAQKVELPKVVEYQQKQLMKNISSEGSCAVVGMSAEQSQLIALQRARAGAIEQAAGVHVTSNSIVTNFQLVADVIKTYSKGFIINEQVEWLPLGQYQKDKNTAPIPEYRVSLIADVYIPKKNITTLGLSGSLNNVIFRDGEKAQIELEVLRDSRVAIFNFTADDKVVMIFPNNYEQNNRISRDKKMAFPSANGKIELEMRTLPNHKRDAEAFFVVAIEDKSEQSFLKLFQPLKSEDFSTFFSKYVSLANYSEELILPYEIVANN